VRVNAVDPVAVAGAVVFGVVLVPKFDARGLAIDAIVFPVLIPGPNALLDAPPPAELACAVDPCVDMPTVGVWAVKPFFPGR
jgi:hypothetical protein